VAQINSSWLGLQTFTRELFTINLQNFQNTVKHSVPGNNCSSMETLQFRGQLAPVATLLKKSKNSANFGRKIQIFDMKVLLLDKLYEISDKNLNCE